MSANDKVHLNTRPFKVVYSRVRLALATLADDHSNKIILFRNDWNDFRMQNMFDLSAVVNGKSHRLGRLRLIFLEHSSSAPVLDDAVAGLDGELEFPLNQSFGFYVTLPETLEVYERLAKLLNRHELMRALNDLHDVSIVDNQRHFPAEMLELRKTIQFTDSLFRGTTERRAFDQSLEILSISVGPKNIYQFKLSLEFKDAAEPLEIDFVFDDNFSWNRIMVLTGKNGAGKTQALQSLIRQLTKRGAGRTLAREATRERLFPMPTFGQVTAISYSVYDRFPPDNFDDQGSDQAYLHFGFYTKHRKLSPARASERAAAAMVKILNDNIESTFSYQQVRLEYLLEALASTLTFDEIELDYVDSDDQVHRLRIISDGALVPAIEMPSLGDFSKASLVFRLNGRDLFLSAGQNQFVLQLTVLTAFLVERSLVIVDEPELGLHPRLEVEYMRALKRLLVHFKSYAIVATHSTLIAREVPSSQIRILARDAGFGWSRMPKMQTLGADITAIADEVFGDVSIESEYEREVLTLADGVGTFEDFELRYGEILSRALLFLVRSRRYNDDAGG